MWVKLMDDPKGRPRYYETSSSIVFTMDKDNICAESVELDNGWAALEWGLIQESAAPAPTSEGSAE
jgi:hypothetical protein